MKISKLEISPIKGVLNGVRASIDGKLVIPAGASKEHWKLKDVSTPHSDRTQVTVIVAGENGAVAKVELQVEGRTALTAEVTVEGGVEKLAFAIGDF